MIVTDYRDTCTILRRQATNKYGGTAADQYDVFAINVPCRFVEKEGRLERQTQDGRNTIYSGVILLDEALLESDEVIIGDNQYRILNVKIIRDFVTGLEFYRRGYLERSASSTYESKKAEPVINP